MKWLQKKAHRLYRSARSTFSVLPPVFCNSIQKSGTHLLVALAGAVPGYRHFQEKCYWHAMLNGTAYDLGATGLCQLLKEKKRGEIYRGHVRWHEDVEQQIGQLGHKMLFIYRDPRDVIISLYHWWNVHEEIPVPVFQRFRELKDREAQILFLINGEDRLNFPSIGDRFMEFLPWLRFPGCLSIRYEDLRSPQHGEATQVSILTYLLGRKPKEEEVFRYIQEVRELANPGRSKTFRSGKGKEWMDLQPMVQELLHEKSAEALKAFGYLASVPDRP
jgi:hypothetical protein